MIEQNHHSAIKAVIGVFFLLLVSCHKQPENHRREVPPPVSRIILSESQIQLANIKVAEINEATVGRNLLFSGVLKVNEQSAVNITSRASGRIQKLFFKNTGELVKKGDSLYQFYSDELVAAEREYATIQNNNWNFSGRYDPSLVLEDRLLFLGMVPSQIEQLRKKGKILFSVTIHSPFTGIIRSVNVTEDQYVNSGQLLFELADNQQLWMEAQVYQEELPLLEVGMPSEVTVPVAGNRPVQSSICFINPSFEQGTTITLIRSIIDNTDKTLHPGMLAHMNVQQQKTRGTVIPASAVIVDKNGSRVWIRNEDGSFSCRQVTTGPQSEDSVLVVSGLEGAKKVVTSGAYLLNSELILKKGTFTVEEEEL